MKVSDITKGSKVSVGGSAGKVTGIDTVKTGLKGRPAKEFVVKFNDGFSATYRAKDLKAAE